MERVKSKNEVRVLELVMTVIYKALAFSPVVICYLFRGEREERGDCGFNSEWRFSWLNALKEQESRELKVLPGIDDRHNQKPPVGRR